MIYRRRHDCGPWLLHSTVIKLGGSNYSASRQVRVSSARPEQLARHGFTAPCCICTHPIQCNLAPVNLTVFHVENINFMFIHPSKQLWRRGFVDKVSFSGWEALKTCVGPRRWVASGSRSRNIFGRDPNQYPPIPHQPTAAHSALAGTAYQDL